MFKTTHVALDERRVHNLLEHFGIEVDVVSLQPYRRSGYARTRRGVIYLKKFPTNYAGLRDRISTLTHPDWGDDRIFTVGSWQTRAVDTKNDPHACTPWRMFRDLLFMVHFHTAVEITIKRHNPRRWSPYSNFIHTDLQPYYKAGCYNSEWCNVCQIQVPLRWSADGEIVMDTALHVASAEHMHNSNVILSNYNKHCPVEEVHNCCIAPKYINDLTVDHARQPFDGSLMLPCKLTETKFYEKIPQQNSFPHQPIERWCVCDSATSPYNTDQVSISARSGSSGTMMFLQMATLSMLQYGIIR